MSTIPSDGGSLLSRRPYALFLAGRFFGTLANGGQAVALGWEVYTIARQTMSKEEASFAVGMVGLVEFLPLFFLTLLAGETADRYNRRRIICLCYLAQLLTAVGLALHSSFGTELWPIFTLAALFGTARAFFQPTAGALGPMLVPPELLPRAIATNSLVAQLASILGPALGGALRAHRPGFRLRSAAVLYATSALCGSVNPCGHSAV